MGLFKALLESLNKNKKWVVAGAILYLIPVFYRFATKSSIVPILNSTLFLYHKNSQITPINLETLGSTFIIPTAVGAIVGTSFLEILFERRFTGLEKYLARVFGSVSFAFLWIAAHYIGSNFFNATAPWGTHLFSSMNFYARNLLVALIVAPIVPYLIEFIYKKLKEKWVRAELNRGIVHVKDASYH